MARPPLGALLGSMLRDLVINQSGKTRLVKPDLLRYKAAGSGWRGVGKAGSSNLLNIRLNTFAEKKGSQVRITAGSGVYPSIPCEISDLFGVNAGGFRESGSFMILSLDKSEAIPEHNTKHSRGADAAPRHEQFRRPAGPLGG
jgi:hypothetical protein